jgi:hypothetical protein
MKPREVFETERFTLNCDTNRYSHERINIGDVKYSLYRNQVLLTSGGNYSATAHPSLNGNYSCQAQAQGRGQTKKIFKNSTQIVLKAKGESRCVVWWLISLLSNEERQTYHISQRYA